MWYDYFYFTLISGLMSVIDTNFETRTGKFVTGTKLCLYFSHLGSAC